MRNRIGMEDSIFIHIHNVSIEYKLPTNIYSNINQLNLYWSNYKQKKYINRLGILWLIQTISCTKFWPWVELKKIKLINEH